MNGRKARALRKSVYGEGSIKVKRTYVQVTAESHKEKKVSFVGRIMRKIIHRRKKSALVAAGVVNTGLRGRYQMAKHPERQGALFQVNG